MQKVSLKDIFVINYISVLMIAALMVNAFGERGSPWRQPLSKLNRSKHIPSTDAVVIKLAHKVLVYITIFHLDLQAKNNFDKEHNQVNRRPSLFKIRIMIKIIPCFAAQNTLGENNIIMN